jgi:hypothetical protein
VWRDSSRSVHPCFLSHLLSSLAFNTFTVTICGYRVKDEPAAGRGRL